MASENLEVVRNIYRAFAQGDIPAVLGAMSPEITWSEAENFLYADGNPYRGPDAVLKGVFKRLGEDWNGFSANAEELLDAGEAVVALGRYRGTRKKTGAKLDAQFVHVWRLKGGKAIGFQQYTDTLQAARAAGAI
jgi:ketosteroid isomerase-like protein